MSNTWRFHPISIKPHIKLAKWFTDLFAKQFSFQSLMFCLVDCSNWSEKNLPLIFQALSKHPILRKPFAPHANFSKNSKQHNFDVLKHLIGKFLPEKMPFFDARLK